MSNSEKNECLKPLQFDHATLSYGIMQTPTIPVHMEAPTFPVHMEAPTVPINMDDIVNPSVATEPQQPVSPLYSPTSPSYGNYFNSSSSSSVAGVKRKIGEVTPYPSPEASNNLPDLDSLTPFNGGSNCIHFGELGNTPDIVRAMQQLPSAFPASQLPDLGTMSMSPTIEGGFTPMQPVVNSEGHITPDTDEVKKSLFGTSSPFASERIHGIQSVQLVDGRRNSTPFTVKEKGSPPKLKGKSKPGKDF